MADKLHIEIEMVNGHLDDATIALMQLASELIECGVIEFNTPHRWNTLSGQTFSVKWRFSEDEQNSANADSPAGVKRTSSEPGKA